jgi:hypothetical protein
MRRAVMGSARALESWGKHGRFSYRGSVEAGVRIVLGRGEGVTLEAETLRALLAHFDRRTVRIGASRNPPRDSLGGWLRSHAEGELLAAYVGPILAREGYAQRVGEGEVRIDAAPATA